MGEFYEGPPRCLFYPKLCWLTLGNSATGNEVDDDGDGVTGDDNNNGDHNGDSNGNGGGTMGSVVLTMATTTATVTATATATALWETDYRSQTTGDVKRYNYCVIMAN